MSVIFKVHIQDLSGGWASVNASPRSRAGAFNWSFSYAICGATTSGPPHWLPLAGMLTLLLTVFPSWCPVAVYSACTSLTSYPLTNLLIHYRAKEPIDTRLERMGKQPCMNLPTLQPFFFFKSNLLRDRTELKTNLAKVLKKNKKDFQSESFFLGSNQPHSSSPLFTSFLPSSSLLPHQ